MPVRQRLLPGLVGLGAFAILGAFTDTAVYRQGWFWIGVGMFISSTFVEPRFTRPQDALLNAVAAVPIVVFAPKSPLTVLWVAYAMFLITVVAASLEASLARGQSAVKQIAFRFCAIFGRAIVIGTIALALDVLHRAAHHLSHFSYLALATALLVAALSVNWPALLRQLRNTEGPNAFALQAVGPRLILVGVEHSSFVVGDGVVVEIERKKTSGVVVAELPHREGIRYEIALDSPVSQVTRRYPSPIRIWSAPREDVLVGSVGAGSTESTVEFEPIVDLETGSPIRIRVKENDLLYQVTSLRLQTADWAGASAVVPHAIARQVGIPEDGFLRGTTRLPAPHETLHDATATVTDLPQEYFAIGTLKGTGIRIGMRLDQTHRGHLAIVGMSGMGKTTVACRVATALAANHVVRALDTTGEYRYRRGVAVWDGKDLDSDGFAVYEPAGEAPNKASEFIKQCMDAGAAEYAQGPDHLTPRVVLLEEAHTFIPERGFIQRNHENAVSYSTRMIMQARKFALSFIIVSQRTAVVSKSGLSQCENYVILRNIDETSLNYLETVVGPDTRRAIPRLKRYEAICVGPAFNADLPVIVTLDP